MRLATSHAHGRTLKMTVRRVHGMEAVTVIRSSPRRFASALMDFWDHRHLVYVLVWRDLRARYKQTLLGALWAVLQPLVTTAVFTLVFKRLAKVPSEGVSYPVFVLCGLIPWQFFAQGVARSGNSLVYERYLLTRVYVPRLIVPVSAVLSGLPDFGVAFGALLGIMLFYGVVPGLSILMAIPFLALAVGAALGVGLLLSPLNARFRDVSYVVPFFLQVWFFLTPIVYPSSLVPGTWKSICFINPIAGIVEGFRWALTGSTPIGAHLIIASVTSVCLSLAFALRYFHWMEQTVADVV